MSRIPIALPSLALLTVAIAGQCPQGAPANMVQWTMGGGYASTFAVDDEGLTSPPVSLATPFFMPGVVGTLDQLWIGSNGEIYLTDSSAGLSQPSGAAQFGVSSIAEMRGAGAGASARICALGGDHMASQVAGGNWTVTVDNEATVAGEVTITWFDLARYSNTTDRFSFRCDLVLATGVVRFSYGDTLPTAARFVGISIGNGVGTTTSQSIDLSSGATSPAGICYEVFDNANLWDLNGQTVTLTPTGGAYASSAASFSPTPCAEASSYGRGCYHVGNSMHQVFVDMPSARATLEGNLLKLFRTPAGYFTSWNAVGSAGFVAPDPQNPSYQVLTGFAPNDDDGNVSFGSSAIPVPGGMVSTWNVSVNGILTAGAVANNPVSWTPTAAAMTDPGVAPELGFYCWHDFTLGDTTPNGTITKEEASGVLYVTWNAVESFPLGTANPSTWQYQIDIATGDVTIVWQSLDATSNPDDMLVGATLAGPGATPGEIQVEKRSEIGLPQDPLLLTILGRPVIASVMTLTVGNIPNVAGIGVTVVRFDQVASTPMSGIDLSPFMPGCDQLLSTPMGIPIWMNFQTPTDAISIPVPSTMPVGDIWHAQALSLFSPGTLPNGQNPWGMLTSNGIKMVFQPQ